MKKPDKERIIKIINDLYEGQLSENMQSDNYSEWLQSIDSIKFIQMVVEIEEEFECEIPDEKLLISEMNSVEKIMNILQEIFELSC